ncbi:MAG: 2Fe-2S iron-sulfur cluster-binding protein [Elusimicrobiaceae bacterium]|nr:2Fe-2S iron-sulfur cluster-binding protein [Elusimicrobiaceae bacterium]
MNRITRHPVLPIAGSRSVEFTFDGETLSAPEGEMLSSALIANGVHVFSHHHKDHSPQGIFCANGQCAQCTVLVDGVPLKACVTPLKKGMKLATVKGLPVLPEPDRGCAAGEVQVKSYDAVIVGGGPAGLAAAVELGRAGASVLLIDDKHRLGGKLVLQTHKFFGSVADCHAGTRGIDIARQLEAELAQYPNIEIWLNSFAAAVFSDNKIGVDRGGVYCLVEPRALLIAAGAREKFLAFPGNTLPGVYGAGAFQTLINRDLVRPCRKLFIVGGGNVGLIAGYHALQAGIEVAGLIEALPQVGGYKVHADKLRRLGVPVYTSHTIVRASGGGHVESVTIAEVDANFKPVPGTFKTLKVDTLLVAVGLDRCAELLTQARRFRMNVYAAGDSEEIAEASAAMFSGKITGRDMARNLGLVKENAPREWKYMLEVLKSRPGKTYPKRTPLANTGVFPVFHCRQEIPCNPCVSACPKNSIKLGTEAITSLPFLDGECIGCGRCVSLCPGLAITLVDYRADAARPLVTMAYEIDRNVLKAGQTVTVTDEEGKELGQAEITKVLDLKTPGSTVLVTVAPQAQAAKLVAGIKLREADRPVPSADQITAETPDETVICRCERVTLGEIRAAIRSGIRDLNQLKAATRVSMGACGGKTCLTQIMAIYRAEGVPFSDVTPNTQRPLLMEMPLGRFCNCQAGGAEPGVTHGDF